MSNRLIQHTMVDGDWTKSVSILWDSDYSPAYLVQTLSHPRAGTHTITDCIEPNVVTLSAVLQSFLGTDEARLFLYKSGVPRESRLWDLNHNGWADMSGRD